ncbi:hypothetical protein PVAG01_10098 [Phlyctema vagabunda]|uniref:Uncharacterized protein n=1 Tax=Phlyctema vagabunda TaxID=108571 RepID=A0ABR4P4Z8_9HELO
MPTRHLKIPRVNQDIYRQYGARQAGMTEWTRDSNGAYNIFFGECFCRAVVMQILDKDGDKFVPGELILCDKDRSYDRRGCLMQHVELEHAHELYLIGQSGKVTGAGNIRREIREEAEASYGVQVQLAQEAAAAAAAEEAAARAAAELAAVKRINRARHLLLDIDWEMSKDETPGQPSRVLTPAKLERVRAYISGIDKQLTELRKLYESNLLSTTEAVSFQRCLAELSKINMLITDVGTAIYTEAQTMDSVRYIVDCAHEIYNVQKQMGLEDVMEVDD